MCAVPLWASRAAPAFPRSCPAMASFLPPQIYRQCPQRFSIVRPAHRSSVAARPLRARRSDTLKPRGSDSSFLPPQIYRQGPRRFQYCPTRASKLCRRASIARTALRYTKAARLRHFPAHAPPWPRSRSPADLPARPAAFSALSDPRIHCAHGASLPQSRSAPRHFRMISLSARPAPRRPAKSRPLARRGTGTAAGCRRAGRSAAAPPPSWPGGS